MVYELNLKNKNKNKKAKTKQKGAIKSISLTLAMNSITNKVRLTNTSMINTVSVRMAQRANIH